MTTVRIARGEQKTVTVSFTDDSGEPVDLKDALVTFIAKHSYRDAEAPLIAKSSDDDGGITLPDDADPPQPTGQAIVELLAEDTEMLADGLTDELVYQATAELADDGPVLAVSGRLVISPRVIELEVVP